MTPEERLDNLLSQWQERHVQGQEASAAELCRDYPELEAELREQIGFLRHMAELREQIPLLRHRNAIPGQPNATAVAPVSVPLLEPATLTEQLALGADGPESGSTSAKNSMLVIPGYEILGELGRGGMGVVYKARQVRLNRLVALKMILHGDHAGAEERLRFLAEAEAIASVRHPGIVQVYEFGTHEGLPYFALEFCPGGSLADKLAGVPLPSREAARSLELIARAMHAAHQAGVLHRDLKPANVLLDATGAPRVTDFGLARQVVRGVGLTQTGAVMGTPSYMAPEQAQGDKSIGTAADIYALGAILYECLTGRPPFRGANTFETLRQVIHQEAVAPRQLSPGVKLDLETITLKCLHKDPSRRYATAEGLAEDLRRFLAGEPIAARSVSKLERAVKWGRRRPAAAGLLILTVVMVATLLGLATWFTGKLRVERDTAQEARQNAHDRAEAEQEARTHAQRQTRRAKEQFQRAETLLADMHTTSGLVAGERGHPTLAALWFANAAVLSRGDAEREWANRVRVRTWSRKIALPVRALPHPGQHLTRVAFHPSSWHLLTVSRQQRCRVWDLESEKPLPWASMDRPVSAACWSPDGSLLALGLPEGTVEVRRFPGGEVLHRLALPGRVAALAFSVDGRYLALGGNVARVWDCRAGAFATPVLAHPRPVVSLAFNARGDRLATGCQDNQARIFGVQGDAKEPLFAPVQHRPYVAGGLDQELFHIESGPIFFGATNQLLTLQGGEPVRWNEQGQQIKKLGGQYIRGFVPSLSGSFLLLASYNTAYLWDVAADRGVGGSVTLSHGLNAAAFSPNEKSLWTACNNRTVQQWSLPGVEAKSETLAHQGPADNVAYSPGGRFLATGQADGLVRVWKLAEGNPLDRRMPADIGSARVRISPDGRWTTAVWSWWRRWNNNHRRCRVYDTVTGRVAGPDLALEGLLRDVAFAPNGQTVATVSGSSKRTTGCLEFWDVRAGKRRFKPVSLPGVPVAVAYSPDGSRVAALWEEGRIVVVEPESGRVVRQFRHEGQTPTWPARPLVGFSPHGLVTVGSNSTVAVHDLSTGLLRFPLLRVDPREAKRIIQCSMLSRDGRLLATGTDGGMLQIWDLSSGLPARTPLRHPDWVMDVKFSADGKRVLTGCRDGMARLWNLDTGDLSCPPFKHADEVTAVTLTPNGHWAITTTRDSKVRVWECHTGKPVTPRLAVAGSATSVAVTPDGRSAVVGTERGPFLTVFDLSDLSDSDNWSEDDLRLLGELTSGHIVREGDLAGLTGQQWLKSWDTLRKRQPGYGSQTRARMDNPIRGIDPALQYDQFHAALHAGNDPAAAVHLDRLLRGQPWNATLHVHQAHIQARLGRRRESATHLMHALLLNPRVSLWPIDPTAGQRGEKAAGASDWPGAIQAFLVAAHQPEAWAGSICNLLLAQAAANDKAGAQQTVEEFVRWLDREKDPQAVFPLFYQAPTVPWEKKAAASLVDHNRRYLRHQRTTDTLHFYGAALYRAGQYAAAQRALAEAVKSHGNGGYADTWLFQAMVARRLDKYDEAARILARFEQWHGSQRFSNWQQRVRWEVLLREARALVGPPPRMPKVSEKE